jgi:hypothetical protein
MLTAAELLGRVQRGEVFADDTKVQYVHHVIGGHSWRPQMTVPAFYLHATQWQPKQWSGQTVGSLVAACELVLAHQACITRWGETPVANLAPVAGGMQWLAAGGGRGGGLTVHCDSDTGATGRQAACTNCRYRR